MEVGFYSLSFSDLMVWAVLIGDVELAEVFWASSGSSNRGDPIRLALIASQMSMRAAEVAILERADYVRNAAVFETWAIELLRKCDESDSLKLLLREHDHWPHTVLRIAMRGHPNGCKKFIGEAYVQRLVDRHWHGHTARATTWQIPEDVSSISIILHCFVRGHIKMTPPKGSSHDFHKRHGWAAAGYEVSRRLFARGRSRSGSFSLLPRSRGSSFNTESEGMSREASLHEKDHHHKGEDDAKSVMKAVVDFLQKGSGLAKNGSGGHGGGHHDPQRPYSPLGDENADENNKGRHGGGGGDGEEGWDHFPIRPTRQVRPQAHLVHNLPISLLRGATTARRLPSTKLHARRWCLLHVGFGSSRRGALSMGAGFTSRRLALLRVGKRPTRKGGVDALHVQHHRCHVALPSTIRVHAAYCRGCHV